jgi:hypothetical protein
MSASSPRHPQANSARARLAAAVAATLPLDLTLTPPTRAAAPQNTPTRPAAPQGAPLSPKMQNEPTGHSVPPSSLITPLSSPPPSRLNRDKFPNEPKLAPQCAPNHANAPQRAPSKRTLTRPLTPNQLRAARLLVAGHSTTAIAAALNIDRHTLADWKRLPLFQHELRRLIDQP